MNQHAHGYLFLLLIAFLDPPFLLSMYDMNFLLCYQFAECAPKTSSVVTPAQ